MYMMHPSCNINTSNNLYDPSRVLDDHCYYYYSSPYLFPSSPSLHHEYTHGDGDNTIQNDFFQDFLVNHNEMIQQKQQIPPENNNNYKNDNNNNNNEEDNSKSKRVGFDKINSPRKKISKKDRHTKIETAQGPRDRRMRLSLNIARKFFDLQDMLGFDKASKTVEWLLSKSLSAITDLSKNFQQVGPNSSLSSTNSEIVIMDELSCSNENLENGMDDKKNLESKKGNKKVVRTIRPLAKESREKARERARERTLEKKSSLHKRMELAGTSNNVLGHGGSLINEGCWIPSTTSTFFNNCQQNGGIIHGLTIPDLEHLSGNFGEASIW